MNEELVELQKALWAIDLIAEKIKLKHSEAYAVIYQSQDALRAKLYDLGLYQIVAEIRCEANESKTPSNL
jgi:predicted ABC-class ATPase